FRARRLGLPPATTNRLVVWAVRHLRIDSSIGQPVCSSTSAGSRKMDAVILDPSLYTVKAVLILDNDGERLFAKYYDETYPTVKEQKSFEKNIFNKTHRTDSEIALLEGLTVVYKSSIDLYFYVIGSSHENELMLMAVLNCLFDSLSQMLRKNVEKRTLLENMEGLFLAVDEIIDGGVILESDPQQVVHRVALRGDDVPLTEQTVSQVRIPNSSTSDF
ncbi:unnamed protein product, partial [Staurois parvus]